MSPAIHSASADDVQSTLTEHYSSQTPLPASNSANRSEGNKLFSASTWIIECPSIPQCYKMLLSLALHVDYSNFGLLFVKLFFLNRYILACYTF